MSWFTKEPDSTLERLCSEIENLSKQVAELKGEQSGLRLSGKIAQLEQEKTRLTIDLERVREDHARENREIEHKLGLHKQRVEQEVELAKREQVVTVREENLKADRDRFEQQMKFIEQRMQGEMDRLNGLTSEILERLPKIEFNRTVEERIGSANGGGDAD